MGAMKKGLNWLSWAGALLIAIALLLKVLFFDMAEVGHNGMAPTLLRGERVLINKRNAPELGSIAVCQHPTEEGWVVARVAATEGMVIDSTRKKLIVDGAPLDFTPGGTTSFHNADTGRTLELTWGIERMGDAAYRIFVGESRQHHVKRTEVPPGKLYLLGDYRAYMGQDSRAFGVVNATDCRGTIVFRLIPEKGLGAGIGHGYFEPVR
jgi:signal peptidase I